MTSDGPRLEELFHDALDLPEVDRAAFLERLAAEHPTLQGQLARLLAGISKGRGLLDEGPVAAELAFGPQGQFPLLDASTADLLGRLVDKPVESSRFDKAQEVGRGGMGVVYRVWDPEIQRDIAMKVAGGLTLRGTTPTPAPTEAPLLKRFLDEARVTGQLEHPGIVPVHEIGIDEGGRLFFTMRLVRGEDFGVLMSQHAGDARWRGTRAIEILLKVCDAIAYAHACGIIHRDLKPANIMVGEYGAVYVVDWGIARVLHAEESHDLRLRPEESSPIDADLGQPTLQTMDGMVVGTPAYLPPEQAQGKVTELSARSDVYALGAILYHLLAGHAPYAGESEPAGPWLVLRKVLEGPPSPLSRLTPRPPAELVSVCDKAMARDPAERYADTGKLAADLRNYLEGRVVRAHQVGALAEIRKWVGRNRHVAAALSLLLTSVVVALSWIGLQSSAHANELREKNEDLTAKEELAREMRGFLESMVNVAHPSRQGPEVTVLTMMSDAADKLRSEFEDDLEVRMSLERTLSDAYGSVGLNEDQEVLLRRAIETRKRWLEGRDDLDTAYWTMNLLDTASKNEFTGPTTAEECRELLGEVRGVVARLAPFDQGWEDLMGSMAARVEVARAILSGESSERGLTPVMVLGFSQIWDVSGDRAKVRAELLFSEIEEAWRLGGRDAASVVVRREIEPFLSSELHRKNFAPGLENLANWAELVADRPDLACALRGGAYDLAQEVELPPYTVLSFLRGYVSLLVRTEQWELALPSARDCAASAAEIAAKDIKGRLRVQVDLIRCLEVLGTSDEVVTAKQARVDLARELRRRREVPLGEALLELGKELRARGDGAAEAVLLEGWGLLEAVDLDTTRDPDLARGLLDAGARELAALYEAAGDPARAEVFRARLTKPDESY